MRLSRSGVPGSRSLGSLACALVLSALAVACGGESKREANSAPANSSGEEPRLQLDAQKIAYQMTGKEDGYRRCFMRSIQSRGAVSFHFLVDARGAVESADVVWSTIGNESVPECLKERLLEQKFGERSQASEGSWTFVFNLTEPLSEKEREKLLRSADKQASGFQLLPGSSGGMDEARFDERIQVNYPLYAHCYRDSITRAGESRGLLRLRLEIDEEGQLKSLEDAGSVLPDPYAADCFAQAFYAINYPKPEGGPVLIRYGLDFE